MRLCSFIRTAHDGHGRTVTTRGDRDVKHMVGVGVVNGNWQGPKLSDFFKRIFLRYFGQWNTFIWAKDSFYDMVIVILSYFHWIFKLNDK